MNNSITDLDTLQACVGKLPGPRDLKVIDFLDDTAMRWIAESPCFFAAFGDEAGIDVSAAGGDKGCVRVLDARSLEIASALLDQPGIARSGQGFGSLFLVPGLDETLRVNGQVSEIVDGRIRIAVGECYLHCAKAFMRSQFWTATPAEPAPPADVDTFIERIRFMALATIDNEGRADLSPKGDPAGQLLKRQADALWYPDRPGNRRIDSFRNILAQPRIAAIALVPGATHVINITGTAAVSIDDTVCASFAVNEKIPKVVTRIEQPRLQVSRSDALSRAQLWPAVRTADGLDPAEIFKAHVKLNRIGGMQAALARAAVSIPGAMRKGLDHDYKKNMY